MRNHSRFDSRWLVKQMARVVSAPMPSGTIDDCSRYETVAQAYVQEAVSQFGLDQELDQGKEKG